MIILHLKVVQMIILHEYPLSIVEHSGFRDFVTSLQSLFKIVSSNTLCSDFLKIHKNEKSKMMKLVDGLRSCIIITSDMWKTSNQKKGYMIITLR